MMWKYIVAVLVLCLVCLTISQSRVHTKTINTLTTKMNEQEVASTNTLPVKITWANQIPANAPINIMLGFGKDKKVYWVAEKVAAKPIVEKKHWWNR